MIMNHNGRSPMWGGNPVAVVASVPTEDELWSLSFENTSGNTSSLNLLTNMGALNTPGISALKEVNTYQLVEPAQPQREMRSSSSLEDIHRIITREMEQPPLDINCAQDNGRTRSTTHEVANDLLYAMPNKDIPFEVIGAHPGYMVKVGLRYSTGAHHNTPVRACKAHNDENDKDISFHIPKHNTTRTTDAGGHFILELLVNSTTESTFQFSLVFRCLNSCHRKYGKFQEIVLQLCDQQRNVLKEKKIPVRICKNVNRDKKPPEEGKKRRGGKTVVPAPKKVKQEPEERDHGTQASTPAVPAFLPCPSRKFCCQAMVDEALMPFVNEFFKLLRTEVLWKEGYKHEGLSVGPPDAV